MASQQRTKLAVVVLFVFDDVFEDCQGSVVAKRLELLAVGGDSAALVNFEAAEGHAKAAGAAGERVGFSAGFTGVDRLRAAELGDAAGPQLGMLPLGAGQMAQHLRADRFRIALGQGEIGAVTLHLGLPVAFEGCQDLFQLGGAQGCGCHRCLLTLRMRIRHFGLHGDTGMVDGPRGPPLSHFGHPFPIAGYSV